MVRRRARASWVRRCGAVISKKVVAVVAKQLCLEIVSVGVRFREVEAVNAVIEVVYAINAQLHILRLACLPVVIDVVKVRSALITSSICLDHSGAINQLRLVFPNVVSDATSQRDHLPLLPEQDLQPG